jgi:hypothetical protein
MAEIDWTTMMRNTKTKAGEAMVEPNAVIVQSFIRRYCTSVVEGDPQKKREKFYAHLVSSTNTSRARLLQPTLSVICHRTQPARRTGYFVLPCFKYTASWEEGVSYKGLLA